MGVLISHDEFVNIVKSKYANIEVLSVYKKHIDKVLVRDELGIRYLVQARRLMQGRRLNLLNAIDKTKLFVIKARLIHGDTYDYSLVEYIEAKLPISIICTIHGKFYMTPDAHLSKKAGCTSCAIRKNQLGQTLPYSEFLSRAKLIHKDKYEYVESTYTKYSSSIKIECPTHGDFTQLVSDHLSNKSGCPTCSKSYNIYSNAEWSELGEVSTNFDSFKLYVIRCWNENEEFIKVGKTFRTMHNRFKKEGGSTMPYHYDIISTIVDSSHAISALEQNIHDALFKFKYKPYIWFGGATECFSNTIEVMNKIKTII